MTGARHGMSLISAITSKGHMRFMIKEKGGVNADVFIEFLKRLLVGATRPICKRALATTAGPSCRRGVDRVKHTVLRHVDKDGKGHGRRDHFDGGAPSPLA